MIQAAYNLNNELRVLPVSAPAECSRDNCSFVTVSSPAVVVDALKQVIVVVSAECAADFVVVCSCNFKLLPCTLLIG